MTWCALSFVRRDATAATFVLFITRTELRGALQDPGSYVHGRSNDELRQLGIGESVLEQLVRKAFKQG